MWRFPKIWEATINIKVIKGGHSSPSSSLAYSLTYFLIRKPCPFFIREILTVAHTKDYKFFGSVDLSSTDS